MAAAPQVLSHMRIEPGSYDMKLGKWPDTATTTNINAEAVAEITVNKLNSALSSKNTKAIVDLFLADSYWRDHLVNSWDLRTLHGKEKIQQFLDEGLRLTKVEVDKSSAFRAPHIGTFNGSDVKGVEFFLDIETTIGKGQGVVRLAEKNNTWFIWNFFVSLKELTGHEEPVRHRRPAGVSHGYSKGRRNWLDNRIETESFANTDPAVLIVGAGQGGLIAAARFKMLNVPALIVDKNDRVGDNWRQRYASLVLHDPCYYDDMPYISFPSHWPLFTPKDKLAEWFEAYAKLLELNVWMKSKIESSSYDDEKKEWTVTVTRKLADGSAQTRVMHPRHVVQATGHSGKKNMPNIRGMDNFKGSRLVHSSEHTGAIPGQAGKKAIVVGACNSSHDICQDFYEKGYDVTMVQRSSTCVVSSDSICNIGLKGLYDEDGPPVDDADMWFFTYPSEVLKTLQVFVSEIMAQNDEKTLTGLTKAGFNVDRGSDNSGLTMKYFQRGGGYYIDVGASQLIVDGKVKVKSGQEIVEVLEHGLKFADGSELEADEIVFATGYQNMRSEARTIFGDDVYSRVGSVWGLNEEGEFRTMWQKSGHPGFWFMGGNLALCRYMSKVLALQIKALEEGICKYGDR